MRALNYQKEINLLHGTALKAVEKVIKLKEQ